MLNNQTGLGQLYRDIHACHICSTVDPYKVLRKMVGVQGCVRAMLVAEAMAESQIRLSGVSHHFTDGRMGTTGRSAEKFLEKFGLSLRPESNNCVYATEIVHCFPGRKNNDKSAAIRRPTNHEVHNCIGNKFLLDEIKLVNPRIIFIMGATSYSTFYKKILNVGHPVALTQKIERITNGEEGFDEYNGIPLIPMQHSSGANPGYHLMLKNHTYIARIKDKIVQMGGVIVL